MNTHEFAASIREQALRMVSRAKASHIGGVLSMADVLAVLYNEVMLLDARDSKMPSRDRFILSKGHCCAGVYAALAIKGFFPLEELETYAMDDARLMSHISHKVPGVEFSTGSLGHGLPFGVGKALAAKLRGNAWRTFVILSDGELNEGSNWEAIMFAAHHRLSRLVAVIDANKLQSLGSVEDTLRMAPLRQKFESFHWHVEEVDGHDVGALRAAFENASAQSDRPTVIIADTVKGKGVDFMENEVKWHYKSPNAEELSSALRQVRGAR